MSKKPQLYKFKDIENRLHTLEPGKSYIKPFVTSKVSNTMCGGLNFLNKVSVPWDLTCDEIIYCMEGTFRLTCDGQSYICNPGDVLYIPKDNHIAYECDEKCVIFYAAYPHDWKQQAGITFVPGMSKNEKIYYENFKDAVERNRKKIPSVHKKLKNAGVKYVLSSWIDLHGIPKSKPVPMSDFEPLCLGKGPQFAVHSISFVPELTPADSDQVMLPDLDSVYICPWDTTTAIIFADLFWDTKVWLVWNLSLLR